MQGQTKPATPPFHLKTGAYNYPYDTGRPYPDPAAPLRGPAACQLAATNSPLSVPFGAPAQRDVSRAKDTSKERTQDDRYDETGPCADL